MREKQPIDDLFKRNLFNAEVTPPTAVRDVLGQKLGWVDAGRNTPGTRPLLMLIIGLASAGAAVWSWNTEEQVGLISNTRIEALAPNQAEQVTGEQVSEAQNNTLPAINAQASTNVPDRSINASERGSDQYSNGSASVAKTPGSKAELHTSSYSESDPVGAVQNDGQEASGTDEMGVGNERMAANHYGALTLDPIPAEPIPATGQTSAKGERIEPTITILSDPSETILARQLTEQGLGDPQELAEERRVPGAGQGTWRNTEVMAAYLNPLAIRSMSDLSPGEPTTRSTPLMYVLPKGTWWIGAFVGMGTVNGHWKGDRVGDLDRAEHWKSTLQGGLQLGRVWRSGWNISVGLGVSSVRSVFKYDEDGPVSSFSEADTTWATGVFAGTSIYTWNIDTLQVQMPGRSLRHEARNNYTAVQVPITLGWHGELRRVRYGAFAGVLAWIPAQRKGLTLQPNNAEGPSSTIPLQDNKVQDRFAMQVHGLAGVSVGYAITEHFDAYVEPMITSPVFGSGKSDMPWLTRPTLQLRFQYEL